MISYSIFQSRAPHTHPAPSRFLPWPCFVLQHSLLVYQRQSSSYFSHLTHSLFARVDTPTSSCRQVSSTSCLTLFSQADPAEQAAGGRQHVVQERSPGGRRRALLLRRQEGSHHPGLPSPACLPTTQSPPPSQSLQVKKCTFHVIFSKIYTGCPKKMYL